MRCFTWRVGCQKIVQYIHWLAKTWIYFTPYVCTERIFDCRPFINNEIFLKKTLLEVGSSHLYASFGTFCVQIDQFLESRWVFEKCLKTVKWLFLKENVVPLIIDQFRRKRCQKKRKDVSYQLLKEFFSRIPVLLNFHMILMTLETILTLTML